MPDITTLDFKSTMTTLTDILFGVAGVIALAALGNMLGWANF